MSTEDHKTLIRRFVERVWNNRALDAIGEFHAPTFIQNGRPTTIEDMHRGVRDVLTEYPDLAATIDDLIAEGDTVAYRWTMRGTNRQTGKQQQFRGHTLMRIAGGKIVEDWYTSDPVDQ